MEQVDLRKPVYVLMLWQNGGERLEIKSPVVLEYFRTFRDSMYEEDENGVIVFYEDAMHRLTLSMWMSVIKIYEAYDKATGGSMCPLTSDNTANRLGVLYTYELADLYNLVRALDFYDSPLLLSYVEQVIVSRLLPMESDEIVEKHPAMPLLDLSGVGLDWQLTKPFLAINRRYNERLITQDYALRAYDVNENIIHAIHHKRPQTRQVIWTGGEFSIVLTSDGLFGCGANVYDQLGRDGGMSVHSFERLSVADTVISVACGKDHALINTTHGLYGVGSNMQGQLGVGTNPLRRDEPRLRPIWIGEWPRPVVLEVACAGAYSMIRTSDAVYACGRNQTGQLGVGDTKTRYVPTKVLLPCDVSVRSLSLSDHSAMFLTSDGAIYMCGLNQVGLVIATPIKVAFPLEMGRPLKVCRGFRHTVVLTTTGLYGLGTTVYGALGPFTYKKDEIKPIVMDWTPIASSYGRAEIKNVFAGHDTTFILLANGSLVACGGDEPHLLGINDSRGPREDYITRFTKVELPDAVITVAVGRMHTLFLTRSGLYGTGANREGQLGLDPAIVGTLVELPIKIPLRVAGVENSVHQ